MPSAFLAEKLDKLTSLAFSDSKLGFWQLMRSGATSLRSSFLRACQSIGVAAPFVAFKTRHMHDDNGHEEM